MENIETIKLNKRMDSMDNVIGVMLIAIGLLLIALGLLAFTIFGLLTYLGRVTP